MTEKSYPWGGTATGDASLAPYSDDEWSDLWNLLFVRDRTQEGVIPTSMTGLTGQLEVSSPGGATINVDTGVAMVDGKIYTNDSAATVTVSGASVYWIIGLRKDFVAQTVRVFGRGGYASRQLALDSLTQNDGVIWEIPLATVLTDAGGSVSTVTDERKYMLRSIAEITLVQATGGRSVDGPSDPVFESANGWVLADGYQEYVLGVWQVPDRYHSGLKITPLFEAWGTGNCRCKLILDWCKVGEAIGTHFVDDDSRDVASTANLLTEYPEYTIDESANPVEPNDLMVLKFQRYGGSASDTIGNSVYFRGFRLTYNARF